MKTCLRSGICLAAVLLLFRPVPSAVSVLPPGFAPAGSAERYGTPEQKKENGSIFDYMDGGGIVYLEHGFRKLIHCEFSNSRNGLITFDRLLGPHFSGTPALANLFATKDPNVRSRGTPPTGGRVIPVHLSGNVYTLPQKGREYDYMALARDAGTKVFTAHPEIHEAFKRAWYESSKVGDLAYEKWQERMFDPGMELFGIRDWGLDYLGATTDLNLIKTIAMAYKDMLLSQGFGIIKYRNTGRKERVGLHGEDLDSFIALLPPKFKFARAA